MLFNVASLSFQDIIILSLICPCGEGGKPNSTPYPPKMQNIRPDGQLRISPLQAIWGYKWPQEDHILHLGYCCDHVVRTPENKKTKDYFLDT